MYQLMAIGRSGHHGQHVVLLVMEGQEHAIEVAQIQSPQMEVKNALEKLRRQTNVTRKLANLVSVKLFL